MNFYFNTQERKDKLYKILEEWKGTPYRHLCAVKGLGADCTLFVWEVFKEMKIAENYIPNLPMKDGYLYYPKDRWMHSEEEVILNVLRSIPYLFEVQTDIYTVPNTGDICCYKFGKCTGHLSIYYEGYIYQVLTKSKLLPVNFNDMRFRRRLSTIFRLIEG